MALCWYHKKLIAHALAASEDLPVGTGNHIRCCPGCQSFYQSERQLTVTLIAEADAQRQSPSPFLHAKIMASLTKRSPEPEPAVFRFGWAAAAAVMAGLLAIGLFVAGRMAIPGTPSGLVNENTGNISFFSAAGIPSGQKLLQWSQTLDQPLESELNSVVSDARTAIRSLADNFLPDGMLAAADRSLFDR
jgi:hypothetical protein